VKNWKLLVGVLLVYGMACALPAWYSHPGEPVYGIVCLFMIPYALLTLFWWANPLFFAGCVALAQGRSFRAMALGIVATALATLFFPLWNRGYGSGIGSAFWVAAMACLAIAGFLAGRSEAGASARSGSTSGEVRASGPHDAPSTSDAGSSSPSKSSTSPSLGDDELAGSGPRGAAQVGQ
jgi:hypothetical protein